jgi:hypothetical protein
MGAWSTLFTHGPTIVDAARKLYAIATRHADAAAPRVDRDDSLYHAVADLQQREAQQAALVADLARELRDVAATIEELRARVRLALTGAAVAAALAVVAVALVLWRLA